jgi:hypothetical protein
VSVQGYEPYSPRQNLQKTIWREFFKKYLAGTLKTHIWREQFQKHIWREHFGGNILTNY